MDFSSLTSHLLDRRFRLLRTIGIADIRYCWKPNIKNWLLVSAWAGLIFYFSTDHFSSLNTGEIFGFVASWLFPDLTTESIEGMHAAIRKLGHWGEYFVLSILFLSALQNETGRKWKLRHAVHTLIFVLMYAIGDEFHQSFVPSRTASFGDVTINALAGVCGISWAYGSGRGILAILASRRAKAD